MRLTVASYNIHKGVGTDGRRDPARIMAVIDELGADVVALQEVDQRFGARSAILSRHLLEDHGWQVASVPIKPDALGWHGNAVLVRECIAIGAVETIALPRIEARGALLATLRHGETEFAVASAHLDLSGLARRWQLRRLCHASRACGHPAILMGDFNAWTNRPGRLPGLANEWQVTQPGPSFPARRPILGLDRIVHSPRFRLIGTCVHDTVLARIASDHLPICATLELLPDL